jgi:O-antigen biosynthesis protein
LHLPETDHASNRQAALLGRLKSVVSSQRRKNLAYKRLLETHRRDVRYLNKTLIRMNDILKHVYSHDLAQARGLKVLLLYYRLRDQLLPPNSRRRYLFDWVVGLLNLEKIAAASPVKINRLARLRTFRGGLGLELREQKRQYQEWIQRHEPNEEEKVRQRRARFKVAPLISIVVPVFNTPKPFLQEMIRSIQRQTYRKWELCLAVSGDQADTLLKLIADLSQGDPRIKVLRQAENLGIAENSNRALTLATGAYVTFSDHDDCLADFALYAIVQALNRNPAVDFLYSDEDKLSADGRRRFNPFFKPDFSPDTLRSYNYICHLTVIKRTLLKRIGGFRPECDGSQDYDLILRATDKARRIVHLPHVLYHWRVHDRSTSQHYAIKAYALEAAQLALRDHLRRKRLQGTVSNGQMPTTYHVQYALKRQPRVAIIMPTKDQAQTLKTCVDSLLEKTAYKNFTLYLVDTGSREKSTFQLYRSLAKNPHIKLFKKSGIFNFSAVNNFAVRRSRGEVLLFLNNDIEVLHTDWLDQMVQLALRPDVGAVGAKLYYPDGTIQHGGVILGIRGVAGHSHKHFSRHDPGYFFRLKATHNLSAVTGACLMLRREVFRQCGGFDEKYQLAFGDVDLCLKIRKHRRLVVWTPYAELVHHESKTRGYEDTLEKQTRFKNEIEYFQRKWKQELSQGDPYYSPNLTLQHEDFSIGTDR